MTGFFGVIPNYLTVEEPAKKITPLTVKEKFWLFAKETFDPFTAASAAAGAALSQVDNDNPKYGVGAGPYAERFGAAVADITTQNFFQDAVLASLLHEGSLPGGFGLAGVAIIHASFPEMDRAYSCDPSKTTPAPKQVEWKRAASRAASRISSSPIFVIYSRWR